MTTAGSGKHDFDSFRASGEPSGVSLAVGSSVGSMRDRLAGMLVRIGITPNTLTLAGFFFTLIGSLHLVMGAGHALPIDPGGPETISRSWHPMAALVWFFLSAACDMLDGAVARLGKLQSDFGAVLDSTVDRLSDIAVYAACAVYFAGAGNITLVLLTVLALANTFLVSYVKARAEDIIPDCSVGFWQRGERFFALLVACLTGHIALYVWVQAIFPFFTVLRRLNYTRLYLRSQAAGLSPPERGIPAGWTRYVMLWRYPRGSAGFDIIAGATILLLVAGPLLIGGLYGEADPLGALLRKMATGN